MVNNHRLTHASQATNISLKWVRAINWTKGETVTNDINSERLLFLLHLSVNSGVKSTEMNVNSGFLSMKRLQASLVLPGWNASPSQGRPQLF